MAIYWQTDSRQHNNGITEPDGFREAQYVNNSLEEESYELLPSGD